MYSTPFSSYSLARFRTWYTVSGASAVVWLWTISNGIPAFSASLQIAALSFPPLSVSSIGYLYSFSDICDARRRRSIAVCSKSVIAIRYTTNSTSTLPFPPFHFANAEQIRFRICRSSCCSTFYPHKRCTRAFWQSLRQCHLSFFCRIRRRSFFRCAALAHTR